MVSVLVVTSGDSDGLRACLHRIRDQAASLDAEVVVVVNAEENALNAESMKVLESLCDRIAFEPTTGKSHGLNLGVRICRGDVIAFTDDDALPRAGWLRNITGPLTRKDRPQDLVGCGGPVTPIYKGRIPLWYRRLIRDENTHCLGPLHDFGSKPFDYPPPDAEHEMGLGAPIGANCAYRRQVFSRYQYRGDLGPNRKTKLGGGEDYELGLRILMDGYRISYSPKARVEHPVSSDRLTVSYVRRRYYILGIEMVRLRRHLGLPELRPALLHERFNEDTKMQNRTISKLQRWLMPSAYLRREIKLEKLRGQLAELEQGRERAVDSLQEDSKTCALPQLESGEGRD